MKKVLFLLVVVAAFVACSKDDDSNIKLNKTEIELLSDQIFTIEAESDGVLTFQSDNEYVATVSNVGVISAKRVGSAKITVSDGKHDGQVTVQVNPKHELYPQPILDFGMSRRDVIAKLGTPIAETSDAIGYSDYSVKAPRVMYLFDDNDKLEATVVMVKTAYSSELGAFMAERYAAVSYDDDTYSVLMANGLNKDTITMLIGAKVYDTSYWMVTYFPYTPSKSGIRDHKTVLDDLFKTLQK